MSHQRSSTLKISSSLLLSAVVCLFLCAFILAGDVPVSGADVTAEAVVLESEEAPVCATTISWFSAELLYRIDEYLYLYVCFRCCGSNGSWSEISYIFFIFDESIDCYPPQQDLFITGGTIVNAHSTIENGDVLVSGKSGKIVEVGRELRVPANARIIDAKGKFVMPGGIDPHTHMQMP